MPTFKPAYLIHGDDHGRIAERRRRLRALAEEDSGPGAVEGFEGEASTPEAVAQALGAMTFALGRRFIVVEGAERWKEKEVAPLAAMLADMPPETTVVFFAREEGRAKAPKALHEAVRKAGGDVSVEETVKPWELPKWVIARGKEVGLTVEPEAARALIGNVGNRQQRLLRELEKLALALGHGSRLEVTQVEELSSGSAERRAWSLADALVAGDQGAAVALLLALRAGGERVPGLIYWMSQRLRLAQEIAESLEAGEPASQVKGRLRMPSRAADHLIADARRAGAERLRRAVETVADLELASRGGTSGAASEDTAALRAITEIAA